MIREGEINMESTILAVIGVILLLLILSIIFKGLGFVLKIITNPKVLMAALVICIIVFVANRMMS